MIATDHPDNILRIERAFAVPPAYAFALWSHPDLVRQWWGPEGHHLTTCEIDFRPGGRWRFNMEKDGTPHWIDGVYHQIVPADRLLFSSHFPEFDVHSIVSVRFVAHPGGTLMKFCQTGFPDTQQRDGHGGGWTSTFGILESLLMKMHGIGSVWPDLPEAKVDGVARDLAEARRRHDEEIEGRE